MVGDNRQQHRSEINNQGQERPILLGDSYAVENDVLKIVDHSVSSQTGAWRTLLIGCGINMWRLDLAILHRYRFFQTQYTASLTSVRMTATCRYVCKTLGLRMGQSRLVHSFPRVKVLHQA